MKTRIHVDQHAIRRNKKTGRRDPPISVKTYRSNAKGNHVEILDAEGRVIARVVYEPDKPLSCGAHVWVETELRTRVVD